VRIVYENLNKLREDVARLVNEGKVVIWWWHIKPLHSVQRHEILNALCYGSLIKPDKKVEGRYVAWSKLTENGRLIRVVFEVQKIDGIYIQVVTAF
jgi:hypothetical protein